MLERLLIYEAERADEERPADAFERLGRLFAAERARRKAAERRVVELEQTIITLRWKRLRGRTQGAVRRRFFEKEQAA